MNQFGNKIVDSARDLFSDRVRWVQTWILSRGLPFIALLTMALSYYQIGAGLVIVPSPIALAIAAALITVMIMCSLDSIRARRWSELTQGYKVLMVFLATLLILGDESGEHSVWYWLFLLLGFWSIAYLYPKQVLIPGEFAITALLVASVTEGANAPVNAWIFISIIFAPVIAWLQWKYHLIKPVLLLSALVLIFWARADIEGPLIILAIAAALALLWLAVYAIRKLTKDDTSSFIQSIGLGVISGLICFVSVKLLAFDFEQALTWWLMSGVFGAVALFLYKRDGEKLKPLLILWSVHWGTFTFIFTWISLLDTIEGAESYGFQFALLCGALALRYTALSLNNNRLYVWSRVYLILAAYTISILLFVSERATVLRLVVLLILFAVALWFSFPKNLAKGLPWWKGVMNPRHIVALRRIWRKSNHYVMSIPFIGATLSAVIKGVGVLTHLKRGGKPIHSGDIMLIIWAISLSFALSHYFDVYIVSIGITDSLLATEEIRSGTLDVEALTAWSTDGNSLLTTQVMYVFAGILLGFCGFIHREPFYPLLSMVGFLLAPIGFLNTGYTFTALFWLTCLISSIGILMVQGLTESNTQRC